MCFSWKTLQDGSRPPTPSTSHLPFEAESWKHWKTSLFPRSSLNPLMLKPFPREVPGPALSRVSFLFLRCTCLNFARASFHPFHFTSLYITFFHFTKSSRFSQMFSVTLYPLWILCVWDWHDSGRDSYYCEAGRMFKHKCMNIFTSWQVCLFSATS